MNNIRRKALAVTAEEKEEWDDRALPFFLACMALLPYPEFKNKIEELKRGQ